MSLQAAAEDPDDFAMQAEGEKEQPGDGLRQHDDQPGVGLRVGVDRGSERVAGMQRNHLAKETECFRQKTNHQTDGEAQGDFHEQPAHQRSTVGDAAQDRPERVDAERDGERKRDPHGLGTSREAGHRHKDESAGHTSQNQQKGEDSCQGK